MRIDRDSFVVETKPGQSAAVAFRIDIIAGDNGWKDIEAESIGSSFVSLSGKDAALIVPKVEQIPDVIAVTRKPEPQIAQDFHAAAEASPVRKYMLKIDDAHIGPGFKEISKALVELGKDEPLLKMGEYWDSPGIQMVEAPASLKEKLEKIPGVYEVEEMKISVLHKKSSGPKL